MSETKDFVLSQTMLRIKDPEKSLAFYRDVLGMILIDRFDFPEMEFSLYFLGYPSENVPEASAERVKWLFEQPGLLSTPITMARKVIGILVITMGTMILVVLVTQG